MKLKNRNGDVFTAHKTKRLPPYFYGKTNWSTQRGHWDSQDITIDDETVRVSFNRHGIQSYFKFNDNWYRVSDYNFPEMTETTFEVIK